MKYPIAALLGLSCSLGFAAPGSVPLPNSDQTVVLSPFEVQSGQDHGYASTNAVSGTRFSVPVSDIPQTIIVINRDFMDDVGATSVLDAAQYVSGVTSTGGGERDVFLVRGYSVSVTLDGLPDSSPEAQGLTTPTELVDRVEIIKGPSAVLYGSTSPGGNVNRISKRPLFDNQVMLEATGGSGGYEHTWFDANLANPGPGTHDVAFRVIGSYSHYDQYVNFRDASRYIMIPEAAWRITPKTTLTVIPYYVYDNHAKTFGNLFQYPPYGLTAPLSFNLPRSADWSTAYARESMMIHRIFASLEQQINSHWSMRLLAIVKSEDDNDQDIIPRDLIHSGNTYLMQRTWRWTYARGVYRDLAYDSFLNFDWGPVNNKVLVLAQYDANGVTIPVYTGRKLSGQNTAIGESSDATSSNLPLINILTYTPGNERPDSVFVSGNTYAYGQVFAWSVQDQISLFSDHLIANAGIRHDHTDQWSLNLLTNKYTTATSNPGGVGINDHYTKHAGLVYKPFPGLSFFFNYSETFAPVFKLNPDGASFTPTQGRTYEIGPKVDLFNGLISGTLSVFDIKQFNVVIASPDPILASAGYSTQGGYNQYQGVEADLYFNLMKNLQVVASGSSLDPTTFNGVTNTSLRVRNVSDATAALFASYKFGPQAEWAGGGGFFYKGKQPGDTGDTFFLPSAIVFNAFLKYDYNKAITVQLNATNLFDKYYADSSVSRDIIYAGPERRVSLTVTYRR